MTHARQLALLVGGEESAFQTHIVAHLARLVEHVEADDAAAVKDDDEGCDRASVLLESEHDRLIAFAAEVGGIQLEVRSLGTNSFIRRKSVFRVS